ncbi:hypothetical protein AAVH_26584 [Aphelenchoides avenae]|nr:hypothetical protein AAVH_26584 [Aphelenchus avenae]
MSKLFIVVLAFSTVSMAVGHQGFSSLSGFLDNPKIKLLSNPAVKDAYPDGETNYDDLLKALAAVQAPITVEKVKEVLRKHALALYYRVTGAEIAFAEVRDSIGNADAKNFVAKVGELIDKYYLVGLLINEQAKEGEALHKLYDGLNDEAKKVVGEKLKEAAEAVEKALYKKCPLCRAHR